MEKEMKAKGYTDSQIRKSMKKAGYVVEEPHKSKYLPLIIGTIVIIAIMGTILFWPNSVDNPIAENSSAISHKSYAKDSAAVSQQSYVDNSLDSNARVTTSTEMINTSDDKQTDTEETNNPEDAAIKQEPQENLEESSVDNADNASRQNPESSETKEIINTSDDKQTDTEDSKDTEISPDEDNQELCNSKAKYTTDICEDYEFELFGFKIKANIAHRQSQSIDELISSYSKNECAIQIISDLLYEDSEIIDVNGITPEMMGSDAHLVDYISKYMKEGKRANTGTREPLMIDEHSIPVIYNKEFPGPMMVGTEKINTARLGEKSSCCKYYYCNDINFKKYNYGDYFAPGQLIVFIPDSFYEPVEVPEGILTFNMNGKLYDIYIPEIKINKTDEWDHNPNDVEGIRSMNEMLSSYGSSGTSYYAILYVAKSGSTFWDKDLTEVARLSPYES